MSIGSRDIREDAFDYLAIHDRNINRDDNDGQVTDCGFSLKSP